MKASFDTSDTIYVCSTFDKTVLMLRTKFQVNVCFGASFSAYLGYS